MDEKKETVIQPPQNIGAYSFYKTDNSCCVTGKPLNGSGYAKNLDEGKSGKVYSLQGLVKEGLVDELALTGLDPKLVEKLEGKNILLVSQLQQFINIGKEKDTGLTQKELKEAVETLYLEVK